jgi:hypothetical protein
MKWLNRLFAPAVRRWPARPRGIRPTLGRQIRGPAADKGTGR